MNPSRRKFPFHSLRKPWADNPNAIWLASTLHLYRNIEGHFFPGCLEAHTREQVRELLTSELLKAAQFSHPYSVAAEELGSLDREFLSEHYLSPSGFQQVMGGEGFVLDEEGMLCGILNFRDHLHLQLTDCREELEGAWNRLMALETGLGESIGYSYSSRFGFLTSDPEMCGTGLRVRLYMHVPALVQTGSLADSLEALSDEMVEVTSMQGSLDEAPGDILMVSNRCSLGLTDESILQSLRTYCLKLHVSEQALRGQIAEQQSPAIKDHVARSFGTLVHSYQLETLEAWNAISLLKLGLDLGWVEGLTHRELNELLFATRRAHLFVEYSEELKTEELPHRRAEFVHEALKNARLTV